MIKDGTLFPQLRVRTGYTFRDAYGRMPEVFARLKEIGCTSAAIVDHGTWGHCRFEQAAKKAGVTPMFGMEIPIITIGADGDPEKTRPRAWILAKDTKAFYNATSKCVQNKGLTAEEFGDLSGVIRFPGGALDKIGSHLYDYIDINPSSILLAARGVKTAREACKPMVITGYNDMPKSDSERFATAWEVRNSVGVRTIETEETIWKTLKLVMSQDEFRKAIENTHAVSELLKESVLQKAPLIHLEGDIMALCREGQRSRLSRGHIKEWTEEYEARLIEEVKQIQLKDFDSYFLVVADIVRYAKENMLVGPARGSSAGSLACYLLAITEVDPIPHNLLFARFIDVSRSDLPDIDIDFADTKRHLVFEYLQAKYGAANVAKLGNINTLQAASVLAQVGKRFGIPFGETVNIKNALITYTSADERYGKGLSDTFNNTSPGKNFQDNFAEAAACMGDLEIHPSHSGVHAAGIVVCNDRISDYCTVNEEGVAQVDKPDSEYLNLLKIDALGLRTLGIIEDSGVVTSEELYSLELNDPEVLKILNDDKMSGVFQFEGDAVRSVTRSVDVDMFSKIDHLTALARPGPLSSGMAQKYIARANGTEPVTYDVPHLEAYLKDTYGVVLYQEQCMQIVRDLGKFDWAQTSAIRKAMSGRKGEEFFNKMRGDFVKGATEQGIDEKSATGIWNSIVTFGAWAFNKCISGDTKVRLAYSNQFDGNEPTIKHLYDRYKKHPTPWIRQRKTMPILLCLNELEGKAYPVMAKDIHFNGVKPCVRLVFSDGESLICTKDHKFLIDGEWSVCGKARIGSSFTRIKNANGKGSSSGRSLIPGDKGWARGFSWEDGKRMELNGKTREQFAFIDRMKDEPCEKCGFKSKSMEAHHTDFDAGRIDPKGLSWLCNSCHKKEHYSYGRNRAYEKGQPITNPSILVSIEDAGEVETYDIEMPDPWHNFELANGIITHNSHSVSYAVVTYWTCWMKRYHKLEYAAACLRTAKDDEQTIAILRELSKEGVEYTAIDPEFSEMNWKSVDGRLVGGIMNAKGYGPVKALKFVQDREKYKEKVADGTVTPKEQAAWMKSSESLSKAEIQYSDLAEAHTKWGHFYRDPRLVGVTSGSPIIGMKEVKDREECLIIGKLTKKVLSDENEPIRVKKRGGKEFKGQSQFVDLMMVDDSTDTAIRFRIRPDKYVDLGKEITESAPNGSWFLVRAWKISGIDMMIVKNIKRIDL
jgi:hypothetical protein